MSFMDEPKVPSLRTGAKTAAIAGRLPALFGQRQRMWSRSLGEMDKTDVPGTHPRFRAHFEFKMLSFLSHFISAEAFLNDARATHL